MLSTLTFVVKLQGIKVCNLAFALQPCLSHAHWLGCAADQDLSLKGWQSYDAAVHCAAVSAAARQGHWKSTTAGKHHAQPMQTFCKHLNHHEASVSQAWPASAPVQRGLSATSTAAPVRYEARPAGITRDSLSMQHTRTAVASTSLLPALLSRLHAGAKRSRQGYES